jgi:hypothetical protein
MIKQTIFINTTSYFANQLFAARSRRFHQLHDRLKKKLWHLRHMQSGNSPTLGSTHPLSCITTMSTVLHSYITLSTQPTVNCWRVCPPAKSLASLYKCTVLPAVCVPSPTRLMAPPSCGEHLAIQPLLNCCAHKPEGSKLRICSFWLLLSCRGKVTSNLIRRFPCCPGCLLIGMPSPLQHITQTPGQPQPGMHCTVQ